MHNSALCIIDKARTQTSNDVPGHDQIASLLHVLILPSNRLPLRKIEL